MIETMLPALFTGEVMMNGLSSLHDSVPMRKNKNILMIYFIRVQFFSIS